MAEKSYIDITPTWSAVAEVCIRVFENPKAPADSREFARSEIKRMGSIIDRMVELQKDESEVE